MSGTQLLPRELREQLTRTATDLCYCSGRLDPGQVRDGDEPDLDERATLHESERDVLAPLIDEGFRHVGTGVGRCAVRFPDESPFSDSVVKFARFGDDPFSAGIVQNKREAVLWYRHGATGQWPLLPVEDYHPTRFRWIVMPYGESIPDPPGDELKTRLDGARSRLGMLPIHIQELRADNFVVVDGDVLMADYGRPDGV